MKRLDENPPPRHPDRPLNEAGGRWWIARVKSRQEKACAWDFLHAGVEYYLPLYTRVTRRRDNNKPRKSILPLFAGYLPFAMDHPANIYTHGRVAGLVEIKNQQRFIRELTAIRSVLEAGVRVEPLERIPQPGEGVIITHGPLVGLAGTVVRVMGERRMLLAVEGLGRATVAIEPGWTAAVA